MKIERVGVFKVVLFFVFVGLFFFFLFFAKEI